MNNTLGTCAAVSPYTPKPQPSIRKAENGYCVYVWDKEYVFESFNSAIEFIREVFQAR